VLSYTNGPFRTTNENETKPNAGRDSNNPMSRNVKYCHTKESPPLISPKKPICK